jgi:hypothetical protein
MLRIAARAERRARVERTRTRARVPKRLIARARPQHRIPEVLEVYERVPERGVVVFPHLREAVEDRLLVRLACEREGLAAVGVGEEEGLGVRGWGGERRDLVEDDLCGLREAVAVA